jgi:hypothetical protein
MNGDQRVDVDDLLSPLREDEAGAREPLPLSIDRGRVVARMMTVAKDAPRERMQRRLALFSSAAVVVLALGVVRWTRHAPVSEVSNDRVVALLSLGGEVTWRGPSAMRLAPGQSATIDAAGDVTTASSGSARLRSSRGVEIELETDTHVGLDEFRGHEASLRLFAGKVWCRVPQLGQRDTFSVVTKEVHVEVRGAVFTIDTSGDGIISVRVDEGVVVVKASTGDVTLTASQSWTNQHPVAPPPRASQTDPPRLTGASPRGTLDRETRLLRAGLAAERSGDLTGATTSLDRLLARFPQSPLAPDARAALARVRSRQRAAP